MDTDGSPDPSPPPPEDAAADASLKEVVRFLTGESMDFDRAAAALGAATQAAPAELLGLRRRLLDEPREDPCERVRRALTGHLGGAGLTAVAPESDEHLAACEDCAEEFGLLKELAAEQAAWLELSRAIREESQPVFLALFRDAWKWVSQTSQAVVSALNEKVDVGRAVGDFFLLPAPSLGGHLASAMPPLQLSSSGASGAPRVNVKVVPVYITVEEKPVWQIEIELSADAGLPNAFVGIGTAGRLLRDKRELRAGRNVNFSLPPPAAGRYRLYFEWKSADEWREQEVELPLVAGPHGATP